MLKLCISHRELINNVLEVVIGVSLIAFPIYTVIYFLYAEYRNSQL